MKRTIKILCFIFSIIFSLLIMIGIPYEKNSSWAIEEESVSSWVETTWVEATIIGKTIEQKGLIFKRTAHLIAIQMKGTEPPTTTLEVTFDQYSSVKLGQTVRIKFYRVGDGSWTPNKVME